MTVKASDPHEDKLSQLWYQACEDYAKETGLAFTNEGLPEMRGPEDLSRQLDKEKDHFEDFRMKKRPLLHAMQVVLAPFENWGDIIAGAAAAAFPPASTIMGAMLLLVRGARKVSDAFNMIIDLFHKLGNFALRLDSYKGIPLSEGMRTIIVKVLVNYLRVCATSHTILGKGSLRARLSKWAKNIFIEDESVSSLLAELEELTSQEHLMVSAHGLKLTHQALRNTEKLLEREDRKTDREQLERVKTALNPISASGQVFSSINENRIPGSGRWIENRLRSWRQGYQPLLWLHGGPGVGKSHLASKIIEDLSESEASIPPVVCSFFFKNNDVDLRSLNNALRTLAWQIATQQPSFALHAEEFSLREDPGNSYVVWRKLLQDYLNAALSDAAIYFVIDGIDEAEPEEQEILFSLLKKTFEAEEDNTEIPSLRVILLSRDSVRPLIDEHSLGWIPEIEIGHEQNKDDLHEYVTQKLQKSKLFRGSPELLDEIVNQICHEAEGLWEWANLVIKSVLRCRTKEQIWKVVKTVPRGISAMLQQELQRLSRVLSLSDGLSDNEGSTDERIAPGIEQLNILLSFVTLAQKPLTVWHLDIILEIILKEEVLNLEDDIRTVYSSLFATRPKDDQDFFGGTEVVTLRHSSFYEFFRTSQDTSPIQVNIDRTEASFIHVFLYSLQEDRTPSSSRTTQDLAEYATQFLPSYLTNAQPAHAGDLREEISSRLADLFAEERNMKWFVLNEQLQQIDKYEFYPDARLSELGEYYIYTDGPEYVNERAQRVLDWLLPETQQTFRAYAQSSSLASDSCPFTVLFSRMVGSWAKLWLDPEEIMEDDGRPAVYPTNLVVYRKMSTGNTEPDLKESLLRVTYRFPSTVLRAAEMQEFPETPMWHARVAQALFLHCCYRKALQHFKIALQQHEESPSFGAQSISVIHRDIARTLTELGKHKEALAHFELTRELQKHVQGRDIPNDQVNALLSIAQMKHRAKRTEEAISTANEAWDIVLRNEDYWWRPDLLSFFEIFLELHQLHRVRSIWDFAFAQYESLSKERNKPDAFHEFLLGSLTFRPRTMYRAFHHALTRDDQSYIDIISEIMAKLYNFTRQGVNPVELRYLLATVLFEKGQTSRGIQGWYEVAAVSQADVKWDISYSHARSICHLAALCLRDADTLTSFEIPSPLAEEPPCSDVCLIISSWLQDHGDATNAREVLRGRVKDCIALLSDDDPYNDSDAFISLFRTFLLAPDSDEDLGAVLYLIKQDNERIMRAHTTEERVKEASQDDQPNDLSEPLDRVLLVDDKDSANEDPLDDVSIWFRTAPLVECLTCKREIGSIHYWYFCRSCPLTTLCPRCYGQFQQAPTKPCDATKFQGICNPQHEFYYTGPFLRSSDRVPDGMIPLISAAGEKQIIWIEEWKERLAKKWEIEDFGFEGELSAWCMRVLPEPHRSRFATLIGPGDP
jgi:tetratricopeptide (TPR) repeat protein/nucleoside-triphosphatase THEP1